MSLRKGFHNLSAEDLRLMIEMSFRLERDAGELKAEFLKKRDQFFAPDHARVTWCHLYELPCQAHFGKVIEAFGMQNEVREIAESDNQIQAASAFINALDQELDEGDATPDEKDQLRTVLASALGVALSLRYSLRCLMIFGVYLNDLVALVRQGGQEGDKALFNALRIDPTVIGCPSVMVRISEATLLDDWQFFKKLKAALLGRFSKREQANFQKMRLVLQVLKEAGAERLTDSQLHELFVNELKLYTATEGGDARKALRKFADQYMTGLSTT